MGNFLLSTSFITDVVPTASTSATNFPASRLTVLGRPFVRPWRSTVTTTTTISLGFELDKNVKLILLYHTNFTSVTVDGIAYTIGKHRWDQRYKLAIIRTGILSSIEITIPTQTPVDGANYFQLGRIFAFDSYVELPANPQSEMPFTLHDPQFVNEGPGVFESQPAGPLYYSEDWNGIWPQTDENALFDAINVRGHEFIAMYRNLGRTYECDIRQRRGEESWQWGTTLLTGGVSFQQEP